jgi:hypothetical protein
MTPQAQSSPAIAGSVLPIKRAEELLQTLPGVIAARIIASETGAVDEIHVLTSAEVTPKQTVRNIESALIAHLGMRVDHRKISVATTLETRKGVESEVKAAAPAQPAAPAIAPIAAAAPPSPAAVPPFAQPVSVSAPMSAPAVSAPAPMAATIAAVVAGGSGHGPRNVFFEDVEVRRSRSKGISCRVTLRKGDTSYTGEAEGMENERTRVELAARAALKAIAEMDKSARVLDLGGARLVEAFEREFVFAAVTAQLARETVMLTGTCEVRESPETACVLAVLDATNRWLLHPRRG